MMTAYRALMAGDWTRRHLNSLVLLSLAVVLAMLYLPALNAYFISDDFQYVSYLFFNIRGVLNGDLLEYWFLRGMDGYLYFRPLGHAFVLLDFVIGGTSPTLYHLTNVLFHLLASFQAFVLVKVLTRRFWPALLTSLLFAVLPVHAEAVSWIAARYDVLAGFLSLLSLTYYALYTRTARVRFYWVAVASFAAALASKETAIVFPVILVVYGILYDWKGLRHTSEWIKRLLVFGLLVWIRLAWFGRGYRDLQLLPEGIGYWISVNLTDLLYPFLTDAYSSLYWILLVGVVLLAVLCRSRREFWLGLAWVPLTMLPTLTSGPSARSLYIPSFGLCLVAATVLTRGYNPRLLQVTARSIAIALIAVLSAALYWRNVAYNRAGEVAAAIPAQVKELYPTLPPDARLVLVGVPDQLPEGPLVYITGLRSAFELAYRRPVEVYKFGAFPVWSDRLDRTFFFQVDHRRVFERVDLVEMLQKRAKCIDGISPAVVWDYSKDVQGWEAWSDLTELQSRDGLLVTESTGSDPYMGSPTFVVPSNEIGPIEITMRVQAQKALLEGAVYWKATGQNDFSPALQSRFTVQADGQFHTYTVDLAATGQLTIGSRIEQLRLDPADAPAQIAIRTIRVYSICALLVDDKCTCTQ